MSTTNAIHAYLRFVSDQSRRVVKSTTTEQYNTLKKIEYYFPNLKLTDINTAFVNSLDKRLRADGLKPNTVWKHHKNFKSFLSYLAGHDLIRVNPYSLFSIKQYGGSKVIVTEDEMEIIMNASMPNFNLSNYLDLFSAGFYTLLRKSDLERLSEAHISHLNFNHFIDITTKKTGQRVVIPAGPKLIEIVSRLKPRKYDDQILNNGLKMAFCSAGLDRKIEVMEYGYSGDSLVKTYKTKRLCDVVSIHTARRSGITAMVRAGVPTRSIMLISGHKTEEALNAYIGISQQENAEILMNHKFFK